MTDSGSMSPDVISRLTMNTEPYLSCDDCFEQVDVLVEAVLISSAAPAEELRVHLLGCSACHEEARSLAAIAAVDHGMSPARALARIDAAILAPDA